MIETADILAGSRVTIRSVDLIANASQLSFAQRR